MFADATAADAPSLITGHANRRGKLSFRQHRTRTRQTQPCPIPVWTDPGGHDRVSDSPGTSALPRAMWFNRR